MPVSTRDGLTVGKPRVLFEGRYLNVRNKSYDVGPDGRFLHSWDRRRRRWGTSMS